MQFLFVTENLEPLGDAYSMRIAAVHLAQGGHDVHVAVLHGHPQQSADLESAGIKVRFVGSPQRPSNSLRWKARIDCLRRLRRLISGMNRPILHAWGEPSATLLRFAARGAEDASFFASHRWAPDDWLVGKWIAETALARNADAVIVPDLAMGEEFDEEGFDPDSLRAIPNGFQSLTSDPFEVRQEMLRHLGLSKGTKLIGTVAPMLPKTRLKDLIWATDLLTCIRDDVHFLIFGSGHQDRALWRFKHCTEAPGHVHFIDPKHAAGWLPGLDVYWHSHLQQPQPIGLLLAMSCEIPVVSVYGAGTSDIIQHQSTGFGVNFGARDEFARWTKFILERPADAVQLAAQGRMHVEQNFAASRTLADLESLYSLRQPLAV